MTAETIDTLVIGAGQAGLAMSYWLGRAGRPHLVLERGRIAERWRSERWDSLAFQFPNWSLELPGFLHPSASPEGFAGRDDIVDFVESYACHIRAPVRTGVTVRRLRGRQARLVAETDAGPIVASNVVVATGPYQRPVIPEASKALSGVVQLHARSYRNPQTLPPGGILIVGAGASGTQIAEDLIRDGRSVWLAVGSHRRVPRRYRGRDFHHWEFALGEWDRPTASRDIREPPPLLTGIDGGRDMDLRELAHLGATLTGRLAAICDGVARFKPDLKDSLAKGDAHYHRFRAAIDAYATGNGLELPAPDPVPLRPDPACVTHPVTQLDLAASGISAVIWATGYALELDWIDLPVFSQRGEPLHTDGVSPVPGLYFLGLPWLSKRKSTLLSGVGEDAERLASHIASRTSNAGCSYSAPRSDSGLLVLRRTLNSGGAHESDARF
ncbi:NAD(P)-binding domain-containing protein [Sphingomonas sp.]|uniref:NAD(P)-binding domain-containing protein n=1 Tax=Sphingomonas sp. TaxID=28214 RepID=UPI0025D00288|nr:NAD(P)-binding domain-containing protein [Sphingomonas sp.]MBV9529460.1 NAD(P)-binding domain-containing protein [Sphingomonas sp.]